MTSVYTQVVHCRKEDYDIYIGRPSFWQNHWSHKPDTQASYSVASRSEAVARYEKHVLATPELLARLDELRDKRLGCWCAPQACHGHILADLAARERILITGSRAWEDEALIHRRLAQLPPSIVIHGAAVGADSHAARVAEECGHKIAAFPADWSRGYQADSLRNEVMLECSPHLVLAFMADKKSPGTQAMLRIARGKQVKCEIWTPQGIEQLPSVPAEKQLGLFDG